MPCKLRLKQKVSAVSPALDGVEDTIVNFELLNTCKSTSLTYSVFHFFFPLLLFITLSKRGWTRSFILSFISFSSILIKWKQCENNNLLLVAIVFVSFLSFRIYSINRPRRLLNFWILRVGSYSRLGAYQIFTIFSKCSMFILQQNNKW